MKRIVIALFILLMIGVVTWPVSATAAVAQGSASYEFMTLLETEASQVEATGGEPG
jgi:hypothetical protein